MFNLGITYRNAGNAREARRWFEMRHAAGDGDASLELAKMYMVSDLEGDRIKALLLTAIQSTNVCEASREEARELLDICVAITFGNLPGFDVVSKTCAGAWVTHGLEDDDDGKCHVVFTYIDTNGKVQTLSNDPYVGRN